MGQGEVGTHCLGDEAEVARLGGVIGVGEDVTVLIVLVAGSGIDARKSLGSWVSSDENGLQSFICLTLPSVLGKLFALGSTCHVSIVSEDQQAHIAILGQEVCSIRGYLTPLITDW